MDTHWERTLSRAMALLARIKRDEIYCPFCGALDGHTERCDYARLLRDVEQQARGR